MAIMLSAIVLVGACYDHSSHSDIVGLLYNSSTVQPHIRDCVLRFVSYTATLCFFSVSGESVGEGDVAIGHRTVRPCPHPPLFCRSPLFWSDTSTAVWTVCFAASLGCQRNAAVDSRHCILLTPSAIAQP